MKPPPPLPTQTVVAAQRVVTPTGVLAPGWLLLDKGLIQRVESGVLPGREDQVRDGWLLPGAGRDRAHHSRGLVAGAEADICLLDWRFEIVAQWEGGQPVTLASTKTS
ncbi:MAG: hypothetical protein K0U64_11190 [Actinomycetia bacterium]|nr:hypothetical protein [Actinomycetes bacterium]